MLTVAILLITDFLGLAPDTKNAELQSRKFIAESLAVQLSSDITDQRMHDAEETLRSVVERNHNVTSAAVRRGSGDLLAEFGDHGRHWTLKQGATSTATQVYVPLYTEKGPWGTVELTFTALTGSSGLLSFRNSFTTVILFMALAGFLVYLFFLKRAILELNPGSVIPERVSQALDTLTEGLLIVDKAGYIVFSNAAFARKVSLPPKSLIGRDSAGFNWVTDSRDSDNGGLPWSLVLEGGEFPKGVTVKLKTKSKETYTFAVNASPITGIAGKIRGMLITFNDITEIEATNQQLRHTLEKLEQSQLEITRQNQELDILASGDPLKSAASRLKARLSASRKALNEIKEGKRSRRPGTLTEGASEEEPEAQPDEQTLESAKQPSLGQTREGVSESGAVLSVADESQDPEDRMAAVPMQATRRDQAHREEARAPNIEPTLCDPTQMSNSVLLFDRIDQSIKRTQRQDTQIALLIMDVDTLQRISDTLGLVAKEKITKILLTCLRGALRLTDTVTLVGNDEPLFTVSGLDTNEIAILLTDLTHTANITTIIQRLFSVVEKPVEVAGRDIYFSVKVGVSLFPLDGRDPATLINNASSASREAKQNPRRNSFHFYSEDLNARAEKQIQLEAELRQALEQDELTIYYQPKVDLKTGKILGMEALVRWQHPRFGMLPPNEFISVAEHTGLIEQIDQWVIRAACQQIRFWQEAGYGTISVAVNLSPVELRNHDLADQIIALLDELRVPASALEIEITETVVRHNVDHVVGILDKLSKAGLSIAVDDFGTGSSSLSYLKRFPLSKVKIDRSFISDFVQGSSDAAIASAIIAMSHSLGLRVVAEGVETEEQLRFLQDLHCDEAQGYLVGKPVPKEEANELLAQFSSIQRMIADYWVNYASVMDQQSIGSASGILEILNDFTEKDSRVAGY